MQGTGAARGQPTNPATDRTTPSTAPGWLLPAARRCRRRVCPHLQCAVPAPRPLHCMDTGQDMQATCTRRRQPTASPPRAASRPQPHQGGWCRLTLQALCVSPLSVHCCALPATPPPHGAQAGHAGYLFQEETAHRQPATDRNTPSTAPGWLVPVGGCLTMHAPCVSTLPVHCCTRPTNPPLHGHRAEYASYPHRDEAAHFQHATDRNTPSTAPGWPPCRRHVCPHFLRAVMSCPRPHRAMDTGQDI